MNKPFIAPCFIPGYTRRYPGRMNAAPVLDTPAPRIIELPTADPPTSGEEHHTPADGGEDFGRCPVCGKPLRPHDPNTGQPRTPPVGKGFASRAKCGQCGTILYYKGGKEWGILLDSDLSDEDRALDKLRW